MQSISVPPSPGIIYLTSTLSHLESTTLTLVVRAQDGGGLTSVINANITIHILQTTLAPSEFERPKYTFSVYEDAPEDSPVGTVKAKESLSKYFLCCIGICYWNIPCISLGCALLKKPFLLSFIVFSNSYHRATSYLVDFNSISQSDTDNNIILK